eukprot:CAMPEP_0194588828 /NCGR_PEP_ID=MMETSP0292-20121207/20114_1 /TAXON_ID=39354 /ORGANISM="Heterosigma akashiwo, Strain CCMP2393" /LENGTH=42 /DNA_ID= /DNA_START= /DNA_END= /DNA_ORIENTATION=
MIQQAMMGVRAAMMDTPGGRFGIGGPGRDRSRDRDQRGGMMD